MFPQPEQPLQPSDTFQLNQSSLILTFSSQCSLAPTPPSSPPSSSWSSEAEFSIEDHDSCPDSFLAMTTPSSSWSYQFASVAGDDDELDGIVARLGGLKLSDEPVERFIELDCIYDI